MSCIHGCRYGRNSTAKTLASYGDFPALTAQTFNVDGIIEVILEEASKTKTTEKETDK